MDWHIEREKGVIGDWPTGEDGEAVAPAFLTHISGNALDIGLTQSLLTSFGIPMVFRFPNNGELGSVILGHAGGGTDVYVPETLLEDAKNIINTENIIEEEI
ncbi:MAG: hypothetical protein IIT41_02900 [Oscillospiraceae bacterium]|nr:hypothetical protein [Oscillospiraceae bacterium]